MCVYNKCNKVQSNKSVHAVRLSTNQTEGAWFLPAETNIIYYYDEQHHRQLGGCRLRIIHTSAKQSTEHITQLHHSIV